MKNKDLKKLTEKLEEVISTNIQNSLEQYQKYSRGLEKAESGEEYKLAEYDETVSEKFKKLLLNLLDYSENVNININSNRIALNTSNLKSVKNKKNYNNSQLLDEDNYLEVVIYKESFMMNRGYSKCTNYKDKTMYDFFFPIITKKLQEINSDNFNEIWSEIMKESGMIRDNNLDHLFSKDD